MVLYIFSKMAADDSEYEQTMQVFTHFVSEMVFQDDLSPKTRKQLESLNQTQLNTICVDLGISFSRNPSTIVEIFRQKKIQQGPEWIINLFLRLNQDYMLGIYLDRYVGSHHDVREKITAIILGRHESLSDKCFLILLQYLGVIDTNFIVNFVENTSERYTIGDEWLPRFRLVLEKFSKQDFANLHSAMISNERLDRFVRQILK